jgi:hypothetical protein
MWKMGAVFLVLLCCSMLAHAQSNTERYMLQERCGKQAAAVFAKDYTPIARTNSGGQRTMNYENRYSERFNKCFFLEILVVVEKGKYTRQYRLYDLNENKEYGSYFESYDTPGYTQCMVRMPCATLKSNGVRSPSRIWRNDRTDAEGAEYYDMPDE